MGAPRVSAAAPCSKRPPDNPYTVQTPSLSETDHAPARPRPRPCNDASRPRGRAVRRAGESPGGRETAAGVGARDKLYGEKKFEEAAAAYLEHVTSRPEDGNAWYNLACCLALAGRKAEAVTALEQAVKAGFRDVDHIEGDSDLDPIRKKKGYRGIVSGLKAAKGPKAATTWVAGEALLPCLVVKPKGYSSKKEYGLILLLHGRGDTAGHFLKRCRGSGGTTSSWRRSRRRT